MGNPMTWLTSSVGTGFAFLQSWQEQEQLREDSKNAMNELTRQQNEANRKSEEDKSDRARQGDKQFASAIAAMEAIGGAGSQDEARFGTEISGNAGLDLARIEGNRRREVQSLQAAKNAEKKRTVRAIKQSQAQFFVTQNNNAAAAFGGSGGQPAPRNPTDAGLGTAAYLNYGNPNQSTIGQGAR